VIVFTASYKVYADVILDYLDPTGTLIHHRVYRESCVESKSDPPVLIKDLRIFKNRQIKDILIVDNCVYAFGFHLDNGVPIVSFSDDK
jgi:CTD small phosphatase-like protein 2